MEPKELLKIIHYSLLSKDGAVPPDRIDKEDNANLDYINNMVKRFDAAIKGSWGACVLVLEIVTHNDVEQENNG